MKTFTRIFILTAAFYAATNFPPIGGSRVAAQPPNNDCMNATTLTVGSSCAMQAFNTNLATQDKAAITCNSNTGNADDDVWFVFSANNDTQTIQVDAAPDFDAVVEILTTPCAGASTITCADNFGADGMETINYYSFAPGNNYLIRVYDFAVGSGGFSICVFGPGAPPPGNDECMNAVTLNVGATCNYSNFMTNGATSSMGAINCNTRTGLADDDVWFIFTASNDTATITVDGAADFDAVIDLRTYPCVGSNNIACSDITFLNGVENLTYTSLGPGTQYHVRVYDYDTAGGGFNICITSPVPPPSCNAQFIFNIDTTLTASFTDSSTGAGALMWSWNFGDTASGSNTSALQNPSHTFTDTGTYNACLTIEDTNGCVNTKCLFVTVPAAGPSYCQPFYSNGTSNGYFIDGVKLLTIENDSTGCSGCPFYQNYTAQSANLIMNDLYTMQVKTGSSTTNANYAIWIDYNQSLSFEPGEKIGEQAGPTAFSLLNFTLSVPDSIPFGPTRMRIRCANSTNILPCDTLSDGETEDYTTVVFPPQCNNSVKDSSEVGVDCGGPCPPCPSCNGSVNFSYVPDSADNKKIYFTDLSFDDSGISTWSWDFGDSTSASPVQNPQHIYTVAGNYNVCLNVTDSDGCSYSICQTVIAGNTNHCINLIKDLDETDIDCGGVDCPPCNPYCIPNPMNGTTNGYFVDGVALGALVNDSTGCTGCPEYVYYTTLPSPALVKGNAYTISITGGSNTNTRYAAWIDFNNDKNLQTPGERLGEVGITTAFQTKFITFTVPTNIPTSATRLRVRGTSSAPGMDACQDYLNGETEDYSVNIVSATHCANGTQDGDETGVDCGGADCLPCPNACYADFSFAVDSDLSVSFTDQSVSGGTAWSWNFGDATNSSLKNPVHQYGAPGVYNVCLAFTKDTTCTATKCLWITLDTTVTPHCTNGVKDADEAGVDCGGSDCQPCGQGCPYDNSALIPVTAPDTGSAPVTVACIKGGQYQRIMMMKAGYTYRIATCGSSFDTQLSLYPAGGGNLLAYNNDACGMQSEIFFTPQVNGNYDVVVDRFPCSNDTMCGILTIEATSAGGCFANYNFNVDNSILKVYFTNTSSPNVVNFTWDFGDNSTGTGANPVHMYAAAGTYEVCLTGSTSGGCTNTTCKWISVGTGSSCNANFQFVVDSNNWVYFNNISTGLHPLTFAWNFGDSTSSNQPGPAHYYAVDSSYWVCLSITTADSCTSTYCNLVTVGGGAAACNAKWNYFADSLDIYFNNLSSPAHLYAWDFGDSTASSVKNPIHTYAAAGTYWVCLTIEDTVNGCVSNYCNSIVAGGTAECNAAYQYIVNTGNVVAFQNMSSGSVNNWLWDFGDSTTGTGQNITHTFPAAGSYWVCLTVSDTSGCANTWCSVVDVGSATCNISVAATGTNVTCNGSATGTATATVSGGTAPYSYEWDNGQSEFGTTATTHTATGLPAGTRSVTVWDANGCDATATVTLTQPTAISVTSTSVPATCGVNDGSASATAGGGTAPYSYSWSNGSVAASATALTAGIHTVTVTDSNGCISGSSVLVGDSSGISVTIDSVADISGCAGSSTGSISITVTGGGAPYDFSWNNGATIEDISGLGAGEYALIITDTNGCSGGINITITEPDDMDITTSGSSTNCGTANGTISVTASGGSGTYNYLWSSGDTDATVSGLGGGSYTVTVTDGNNCAESAIAVVSETGAATITYTVTNVSCNGGSDGAIDLTVSGGMPPYTYTWTTGSMSQDVTGLDADDYIVIITSSNGCMAIRSIEVTQPTVLSSSASGVNPHCSMADGSATVVASGGTSPYTYLWSNGETSSLNADISSGTHTITTTDAEGCMSTASVTISEAAEPQTICMVTVDSATGKNVIVWEKTGGVGTAVYNLYRETSTTGVYTLGGQVLYTSESSWLDPLADPKTKSNRYKISAVDSCGNESTISTPHKTMHLTVNLGISDERNLIWEKYDGFTYGSYIVWRGTDVTPLAPIDTITSILTTYSDWDVITADSLYYEVEVVHPSGCTSTLLKIKTYNSSKSNTASLEAPALPLATSTSSTDASCNGSFDGTATVTVSGGKTPYTYLWSDPLAQSTSTATGLAADTYTVTITDADGSTITASATITEPALLVLSLDTIIDATTPGNNNGEIQITISGGTGAYTFAWTSGDITEDISALPADTYNVVVTDANGCTVTNTFVVDLVNAIISTAQQNKVTVYPNPAKDVLYIIVEGNNVKEVRLMNIFGQLIFTGQTTSSHTYRQASGQTGIDLTGISEGIYRLVIVTDEEMVGVNVVVEK